MIGKLFTLGRLVRIRCEVCSFHSDSGGLNFHQHRVNFKGEEIFDFCFKKGDCGWFFISVKVDDKKGFDGIWEEVNRCYGVEKVC